LLEWESEIDKAAEEMLQRATSTTSDAIAQGIIDGFGEGYDEVADFSTNFEEMMKAALINALKSAILEGPALKKFTDDFTKAMDDNIMTPAEREQLKKDWDELIQMGLDKAKYYKEITGQDLITAKETTATESTTATKAEGLTGAIKGITAEQADLLGGVLISMREYQVKGYTDTKGALLSISDVLNRQVIGQSEIRNKELLNFTGQFTTLIDINRQTNQQIIDMRQFDLSEILIVNRQIAANTSFNKELPAIKAELIAMNAQIKNL
jgi:hypothetical protein